MTDPERQLLEAGFAELPVTTLNGSKRLWTHPAIPDVGPVSVETALAILKLGRGEGDG